MKIEQLKQIVKVADTGSISAAADKLYLSHSTLSSSLRAAEQEFGKEIFIRKPNGVTLTEFGKRVYDQAMVVAYEMDAFEKASAMEDKTVSLSVSCMNEMTDHGAFINLYRKYAHEAITLSIKKDRGMQIVEDVAKGRTDVGIMALQGEMKKVYKNAFASRELAYEKLADRRVAVIISTSSPLYSLAGDTISREDLSRYPLAYYENGFLDSTADTMLGMPEGGIKRKIGFNSRESIMIYVGSTDAYTFDIFGDNLDENFRQFTLKGTDAKAEIGWIHDPSRKLTPQAKEYIAALKENF